MLRERLAAELERNDLALAAGQHAVLLPGLSATAQANPLDERLAGQLMLALYRSGRQADALEHYERVRRRLADDLGADPAPALRVLHQQILTADPAIAVHAGDGRDTALGAAEEAAGHQRTWLTAPRQLPAAPPAFTGRAEQLAEIDKALAAHPDRANTVVISAIGGTGGIGKTWLSLQWAHLNIDKYPDGQLYVNLRGFDPAGEPLQPEVAVRGFLEALGVPAAGIPAQLDGQSALYRSLTLGRRMLIMLDNARDSIQVAPLLPSSPSCTVLVTSRNLLMGLVTAHGARPLVLDVLTDAEARELLVRHLGADRVAAEPDHAAALVQHCAGLPLALGVVAARATIHPELSLAVLAEELREASTRLDALDAGELAVNLRAVLSWSLDALGSDAAELFALLGLAPGPDVSLAAVASLAALPVGRARGLLAELGHAHLLNEFAPRRFRMHDLVRLFAAERARQDPQRAAQATERMLDFYLHTAADADRPLTPGRAPVTIPAPRAGVHPEPIAGHDEGLAWFTAEREALVSAVEHAAAGGFDRHAWQLAWAMNRFLSIREHWHDLLTTQNLALAAAGRLADPIARTHAHRGLGIAYIGLRRYAEAQVQLLRALESSVEVGDLLCRAQAHRSLGRLFARQGRYAEALTHDERALDLWRNAGNEAGLATALNAVGWHLTHLGDHVGALRHCTEALQLYRAFGDRIGEALTWDSIGYVRLHLGEYQESTECYRRAIGLFGELGHRVHVGATLVYLGDVYAAAGDLAAARSSWLESLHIYEDLGDPTAAKVRAKLSQAAHVEDSGSNAPGVDVS
jgi:tetratricopeptide (TPR) repeat protein